MNEGSKLHTCFNVALTLIGYRKPPQLDHYFIISASLVPVAVSTHILDWKIRQKRPATQP